MPITAANFTLINSSPASVASLNAALDYLQTKSPEMAAPIIAAAAAGNVQIVFADPVTNPHDGFGTVNGQPTIVWDPNSGLIIQDSAQNMLGVQSPANGLIHEMVHAIDPQQATQVNLPNAQYANEADGAAVMYADAVAADCGEIQRLNYEGAEIAVTNTTAHTGADENGVQTWYQTNSAGYTEIGPAYQPGAAEPTFGSDPANNGPWEPDWPTGDTPTEPTDPTDPGDPPADGGGDTGGGGCVHVASLLPDGTLAGAVAVGSTMQLADESTLEKGTGVVTFSALKEAPGYRITTQSGASLVCSDTAPIPTRDHGLQTPQRLEGQYVAVRWDEGGKEYVGWERVTKVDSVGTIQVQHITVGDKCFWAGEKRGAYILHHNLKDSGGGGGGSGEDPDPWWYDGCSTTAPGVDSAPLPQDPATDAAQLVGVAPSGLDPMGMV